VSEQDSGSPEVRAATYGMIAAVLVSYVYMLDPANRDFGLSAIPLLKYIPLELAVGAWTLYAIAGSTPRRTRGPVLYLTVLAGMMMAGSVFTIVARGSALEDSFFGRGLGLLSFFPAYLMCSRQSEKEFFCRVLWLPTVLVGVLMTTRLILWHLGWRLEGVTHIYHEEIFLPAAGAVLVAVMFRRSVLGIGLAFVLATAGIVTFKNTGLLASFLVGCILTAVVWQKEKADRASGMMLKRVCVVLGSITLLIVSASLLLFQRGLLPSGSPEVRLFTYAQRLMMFLDAPIFGQVYTGSPMFSLLRSGGESPLLTPSHSDLLDLLAFGGIVGLMLFLHPVGGVAVRAVREFLRKAEPRSWALSYFLTVILVLGAELVVNPILHQPALALNFWLALGFLAARQQVMQAKRVRFPTAPSDGGSHMIETGESRRE